MSAISTVKELLETGMLAGALTVISLAAGLLAVLCLQEWKTVRNERALKARDELRRRLSDD